MFNKTERRAASLRQLSFCKYRISHDSSWEISQSDVLEWDCSCVACDRRRCATS